MQDVKPNTKQWNKGSVVSMLSPKTQWRQFDSRLANISQAVDIAHDILPHLACRHANWQVGMSIILFLLLPGFKEGGNGVQEEVWRRRDWWARATVSEQCPAAAQNCLPGHRSGYFLSPCPTFLQLITATLAGQLLPVAPESSVPQLPGCPVQGLACEEEAVAYNG